MTTKDITLQQSTLYACIVLRAVLIYLRICRGIQLFFSTAHFKQNEEQDKSRTLEDPTNLRCRKCRRCLIDSTSLLKVGEL